MFFPWYGTLLLTAALGAACLPAFGADGGSALPVGDRVPAKLVVGGGVPPTPAPLAQDEKDAALREEITRLKQRLDELEKALKPAAPQAPSPPAVQLLRDSPAAGKEPRDSPADKPADKPKPPEPAAAARPPSPSGGGGAPTAGGSRGGVSSRGGARLEVSGYAQGRITNYGTAAGDRTPTAVDFQVPRFRSRLAYILDPHWQAVLEMHAGSRGTSAVSTSARDMFVQYQNRGYGARLGQAKIPFGYEVYVEGSAERIELERARIFGAVFPDNRDLGFFVRTVPETQNATWFGAAVYNGNGINRMDNNDAKNVAATVKAPVGDHHVFGLSGTYGNFRPGNNFSSIKRTRIRELYGGEYRFSSGRFFAYTEIAAGKNQGSPIWGGYAGARYNTGHLGGPFARYDLFDPNRDTAGDTFRRLALGWWKDVTANVRLTAEYDLVDNPSEGSDDLFGFQVQARY